MRFALQQKKMNRIKKLTFWKNFVKILNLLATLSCICLIMQLTGLVAEYEIYDYSFQSAFVISIKILTGTISYIIDKKYWRLLAEDCAVYPFETAKIL